MEFEERSTAFMQTFILKKFMVSTIRRRSSAALNPDAWYYETFVWELNEKGERGKLIDESASPDYEHSALLHHQKISRYFLVYEVMTSCR
jgi:hypothetical protein